MNRRLLWVCLLRGREFALPLWGRTLCFQKVFLNFPQPPPLSGFKHLSCLQDRARRSGARDSSPPVAGAGTPSSAGVSGDVQGGGRSREQARAQKWCIDYGAGDVSSVTDAKGDAILSKQDEADAVGSGARPPCAGVGSLSGTKVGRPHVNSRIQFGVSVNPTGASSHACASYLDALLSAPARAPAASVVARRSAPSSAAVGLCMHDDGTLVHGACSSSWSDGFQQFPEASCRRRSPPVTSGKGVGSAPRARGVPKVGFRIGRRFAPCLRGGGRGKFSAGWWCTEEGCWSLSRKVTRHRYLEGNGRCGHTFRPPGGS